MDNICSRIKDKALSVFTFATKFLNKGQDRSVKAKKNIAASLFLKGFSIILSIIIVPITLNYVNVSEYGIWLTLSSIVVWFSFFDIGLTQGLRNKFAEAIARGEDELAQIYVSTTFAILVIICSGLWVIFLITNQFLNWAQLLNLSPEMQNEVSILAIIVFSFFCLQFVLRIIHTIFAATQQPALSSLVSVVNQAIQFICIFTGLIHCRHAGTMLTGIAV